MNTKLIVKEILLPLQAIIGIVEKNESCPIVSHVLIQIKGENLTLTTTDLETELTATNKITHPKDGNGEDSWVVDATDLLGFLLKFKQDETIEFVKESSETDSFDASLSIRANNNHIQMNALGVKDFLLTPQIESPEIIHVNRLALIDLIKKTFFSTAHQDIRVYLNAVYFEFTSDDIAATASDGYRLATGKIKQTNKLTDKKTVLIPKKSLRELIKILEKDKSNEATIALSSEYFQLTSDNTTITSHLLDAKFPRYSEVIPTEKENTVTINRQSFLDNIHQAAVFASNDPQDTSDIKLSFKSNQISTSIHSQRGRAKSKLDIDSSKGDGLSEEVVFNIHYLIPILESIPTETINIIIPTPWDSPWLITSADDDAFQYVIMPIKE